MAAIAGGHSRSFRGSDSSVFVPLQQGNDSHIWDPHGPNSSMAGMPPYHDWDLDGFVEYEMHPGMPGMEMSRRSMGILILT